MRPHHGLLDAVVPSARISGGKHDLCIGECVDEILEEVGRGEVDGGVEAAVLYRKEKEFKLKNKENVG